MKIARHGNGYIEVSGCPWCGNADLWVIDGKWHIDTDDGLRGPEASFCFVCGEKLPPVTIEQQRQIVPARAE